jgi:hypothetical protein
MGRQGYRSSEAGRVGPTVAAAGDMKSLAIVIAVTSLFVFSCANGDVPVADSPEGRVPPADAEVPAGSARDVIIDSPANGSAFESNPIRLEGRARTFENNVTLELRDEAGAPILTSWATATGEIGELSPWTTELWVTDWPGAELAIRAADYSAKDGSLRSVDEVRLRNESEPREITLYFPHMERSGGDCSRVYPLNRNVPATPSMARLLTEALIQGPTDREKAEGFSFDFPRSGRVQSIALRDGTLTIDFTSDLQNVGGSCRVQAIRAAIEKTMLQLPTVERVRILAGGSEELALQP